MIVTLAVSGPFTWSASVTGGKSEAWVGPGVGWRATTVQPESGASSCELCGTSNTAVGGGAPKVGTLVGVDFAQAESTTLTRSTKMTKFFLMSFSTFKYPAILPVYPRIGSVGILDSHGFIILEYDWFYYEREEVVV